MKRKYKMILNTTAIVAVSSVGLSTVVACGSKTTKKEKIKSKHKSVHKRGTTGNSRTGSTVTNVNKPRVKHNDRDRHISIERDGLPSVDGISSWRFNGTTYATKDEAKKAKETYINKKIDEIADEAKANDVYTYNGMQYGSRQKLIDKLKEEYEVINLYVDPTSQHQLPGYKIGNEYFKSPDEAADKYLESGHGDGTGHDYEEKLYDEQSGTFGHNKSIKGKNRMFKGARDNNVYVPKTLIDKIKINKHDFTTALLNNPTEFKFEQSKLMSSNEMKDLKSFEDYRKELSKAMWEFGMDESWWKRKIYFWGRLYSVASVHLEFNTPSITLPSGLKIDLFKDTKANNPDYHGEWKSENISHNKYWLFVHGTTAGTFHEANNGKPDKGHDIRNINSQEHNTLQWLVDNKIKTMADLDYIWNLITTQPLFEKGDKGSNTGKPWFRKVTWKELLQKPYFKDKDWIDPNLYKPNYDGWNFEKRFQVKDKWFKTKEDASKYIANNNITNGRIKDVINHKIIDTDFKLDLSKIDKTNSLEQRKKSLIKLFVDNGISKITFKTELGVEGSSFIEIEGKYRKEHPTEWEFENKIYSTKQDLMNAIKEKLKNIKSSNSQELVNISEIGDTLPTKINKAAVLGLNEKPTDKSGDLTGNTYKSVLTYKKDGKDVIVADSNPAPIAGHNPTKTEILNSIKNNNLSEVSKVWFTKTKPNNNAKPIGKIVVAKDTGNIINKSGVLLNRNFLSNDEMIFQASKAVKSTKDWFEWQNKLITREKYREEYKATYKRKHKGELTIDELIVNSNETGTFDDIVLPSRRVIGPNGKGVIKSFGHIDKFSPRLKHHNRFTISVKHPHGLFKVVDNDKDITNLSNGDIVKITIQKEHSLLTRIIEVKGLKRNLFDFLQSNDPKDKTVLNALMTKFKGIKSSLNKKMGESANELVEAFKTYFTTPSQNRNKTTLVKVFHKMHDLIDKEIFDGFVTNSDSIINEIIKTLEDNNVDTSSFSNDGQTLNQKLKVLINDILDALKIFVDNSFNFIEHSIDWTPTWKTDNNLIDPKTATGKDKLFLNKLFAKKDNLLNNAGDEKDEKDAAFKTIDSLMEGELKVYKETKNGQTIYHVVKEVNSRKIVNKFKENFKFLDIDPKGTLDNFHINPKGVLGNTLSKALADARRRREEAKQNSASTKSIYSINTNQNVQSYTSIDLNWILNILNNEMVKTFLPQIKSLLNGNIDELLNLIDSLGGSALGITGISNIKNVFKSITGSLSQTAILTETNLQALLTYVFGDKGHVVMDFVEKDGKFILKDYYSPEITTIAKSNRTNIVYRKDDLEKMIKNIKPLFDLIFNLMGSA